MIPRLEVETTFPIGLLSELAGMEGSRICESVARHDAPDYVLRAIRRQVNAYFNVSEFAGKRLMDFGCGSGASTFGLAAMLPDTEVVGIELEESNLVTARAIAKYRQLPNVRFLKSPSGAELPAEAGQFDFIMLSAVWEHLLPAERPVITSLLWSALKPGGALLINQTPYRWFPFEHHTTGLWGINYLPDSLASYVARHWSREVPEELAVCTWQQLLRRGIRGGTEWEVLRQIRSAGGRAELKRPNLPLADRAEYWYQATSPRLQWAKRLLAGIFRVTDTVAGTIPVPHLDMVVRKTS